MGALRDAHWEFLKLPNNCQLDEKDENSAPTKPSALASCSHGI